MCSAVATIPDGRLRIYVLDVGQGDAILLRTPGGRHILVDGGPDPLLLSARLGRILPFWQRRLDLVVATHGDVDHIGGLIPLPGRYPTEYVLGPPGIDRSELGQVWQQAAIASGATILTASQGMAIELGEGLRLRVLHPQTAQAMLPGADPNRHSVVLKLEMGRFTALLTGDIDAYAEQEILARGEASYVTVLKVAHHGAASGTSAAWLEATRPQIAVVSVGADNLHDHPNAQVLERLAAAGCRVYRTDKDGTIEIITDGEHVWIRTHKGRYHDRPYWRQSGSESYADRHPAVAGQRYARGVALL
jgi:competence protein ComEC